MPAGTSVVVMVNVMVRFIKSGYLKALQNDISWVYGSACVQQENKRTTVFYLYDSPVGFISQLGRAKSSGRREIAECAWRFVFWRCPSDAFSAQRHPDQSRLRVARHDPSSFCVAKRRWPCRHDSFFEQGDAPLRHLGIRSQNHRRSICPISIQIKIVGILLKYSLLHGRGILRPFSFCYRYRFGLREFGSFC